MRPGPHICIVVLSDEGLQVHRQRTFSQARGAMPRDCRESQSSTQPSIVVTFKSSRHKVEYHTSCSIRKFAVTRQSTLPLHSPLLMLRITSMNALIPTVRKLHPIRHVCESGGSGTGLLLKHIEVQRLFGSPSFRAGAKLSRRFNTSRRSRGDLWSKP